MIKRPDPLLRSDGIDKDLLDTKTLEQAKALVPSGGFLKEDLKKIFDELLDEYFKGKDLDRYKDEFTVKLNEFAREFRVWMRDEINKEAQRLKDDFMKELQSL